METNHKETIMEIIRLVEASISASNTIIENHPTTELDYFQGRAREAQYILDCIKIMIGEQ